MNERAEDIHVDALAFERLCQKVKTIQEFRWKGGDSYAGPVDPRAVLLSLKGSNPNAPSPELRLVLADHVPKLVVNGCEGLRPGRVFHIIMARLDDNLGLPDLDEATGVLESLTTLSFEGATVELLCQIKRDYRLLFRKSPQDH